MFGAIVRGGDAGDLSYLAVLCVDDYVRYDWLGGRLGPLCVPYSIGKLASRYVSDPDRVRYADFGHFDGRPLPSPPGCPSAGGFTPCGGGCPPCPGDMLCASRSPLHPFGFCIPHNTDAIGTCRIVDAGPDSGECRDASTACFTFTVEPEAQALADLHGVCLPVDECQSLANGLPGGGRCTPQ
jgi:hypothetical protein